MAGEKYMVAAGENPLQIAIRNILNPNGFIFLGNCSDSISLMRLIRSYQPDFIVVDLGIQLRELRTTLETIDDEMLCACIVIGEYKNAEMSRLVEKSRVISSCPKHLISDLLIHTVELSMVNFKRVYELNRKLQEATLNLETRKVVERAKWILIERDGISESEAYERMRTKSMERRLSMKAIADAIIFTHEISGKGKG